MNHTMTLIEKNLREGLHIGFAMAVGFLLWHNFWEWWQALLLVAGIIAVPYIVGRWLLVLVFWMIVAPLLLVGTYISIFWVVSSSDTTVPVNITSKEQDVRTGRYGTPSITYYIIWAVDEQGYHYNVSVRSSQWESLSEGDKTSITYHDERVAGRWLPRRITTMLGQESIVSGGGRFGTPMEGINTAMVMGASALPFAVLAALYLKYRGEAKKRIERIDWIKTQMCHKVLEEPGISHTGLLQSVAENRDLKVVAINQLVDEGKVKCEQRGRVRKYFALSVVTPPSPKS